MFCFQFGGGGGGRQLTRHFIEDILSEDPGRMKKQRTSFSGWQIYELERIFEEKKYINSEERNRLGRSVLNKYNLMLCPIEYLFAVT